MPPPRLEGEIRAALSPVLWAGRLSGTLPLDGRLRLSPIWASLSACLALAAPLTAALLHISIGFHNSFSRLLFAGGAWLLCLSTTLLVLLAFHSGPLYARLVDGIASLEHRLQNIGVKPKYNTQSILADIGIRTVLLFATNLFNYNKTPTLMMFCTKTLALYYTQWCISCVEMHIVALATYLGDLFSSLRESLPGREVERHLEEATRLQELCKSFHSLFARQALVISSCLFLSTTLDLYFFMIVLRESALKLINHPSTYYRCCTRAYEIWRLASSVYHLGQQGKRFGEKLYSTALQDPSDELARNEKVLLYFSMKEEVKFLACGFFPIDFTLIFSVVTAVTNYLVILVQFGNKIKIPHVLIINAENTTSDK